MPDMMLDEETRQRLASALLPGVPLDAIAFAYGAAPGDEVRSGRFFSGRSSSALAANAFGVFLSPSLCRDPIPGFEMWGRPVEPVRLECSVRFPWRGGRHPWPDVLIATQAALIAVESK